MPIATGVSRPASPERGSTNSDSLLTTGAPRASGTVGRDSTAFSTEYTPNPDAAVQSAVLRASQDPNAGFGMAGGATASSFSIDGLEEMRIYGGGFGGSGRCAFLRVNKLCYAAVGVLVACSVLLGVVLDQRAPAVHDRVAAAAGTVPPPPEPLPPPPNPKPAPDGPTPPPPAPKMVCTKGLTVRDSTSASCPDDLQVGQVCYYACARGYSLAGPHICDDDGTFRGGGCTLAGCQPKDEIANTATDCGSLGAYGDTCDVSCSAGYTDVPNQPGSVHTFVCAIGGQWKGTPINCTNIDECSGHDNVCPEGKRCIDTMGSYECSACAPPLIDDGAGGCKDAAATDCTKGLVNIPHSNRASVGCTGHQPGISECVYTCDVGYTRTGDHKCDATGTWSGGSCEANACHSGATIANSNRNDEISNNVCTGVTGDTCDYVCDEGFVPHGEHTCKSSGAWSGGSCTSGACRRSLIKDVAHSQTVPGFCPSGGKEGHLHDVCNITCVSGYHTEGSGQYECTGATWAPVGPATTCDDIDECAESNSPCNALHEACTNTDGSFACGACASGYHDSGKISISGTSCVGNPCPSMRIQHQKADDPQCTGTTGSVCQYKCAAGYTARGHLVCSPQPINPVAGQWKGGECVPNSCTHGLTIAHSDRVPTNQCHGATGDECTYVCDSGYAKPPGTAGKHVCGVDGTYTGGVCHQLSCPVSGNNGLAFDHTEVVYSHSRINGKNTQVAYIDCLAGWQATGAPTMTVPHGDSEQTYAFTCGEDGKWSPQFAGLLPQTNGVLCSAVDCGSFTVDHGSVSMPNGHEYSADADHPVVATTLCLDGYSLHLGSTKTRTCGADGQWSGSAPRCQRDLTCPTLRAPADGRAPTVSGTTATYHCNPTYLLHGANRDGSSTGCPAADTTCGTRRCMSGMWQGPEPTCDAANSDASTTCAALPPTIPHGHVSYSPLRGGQATVSCVNGAFFSGSMDRTMQMHCDQGEWDPPMPTCQLNGR